MAVRGGPDRPGGVREAHRRVLRHLRPPRRGAPRPARRGPGPLADGAVPRADPGVQGHRPAARGPALRLRTGAARRAGHDRRRHLRRHRLGGHRGVPRPRLPRHLRVAPARPCHRRAASPDDDGAVGERAQHRRRRQFRRLPGPREGHVRRRGVPAPSSSRRRQLHQLCPCDGADRLLRGGVAGPGGSVGRRARGVRRADRQFRQRVRGLRGTPHGLGNVAARRGQQHQRHPHEVLRNRPPGDPRGRPHHVAEHGHSVCRPIWSACCSS